MKRAIASLLASALICSAALADEGMWTFDNFPSSVVQKNYGVGIDGAWLDRVRESTVRLAGCTASFVSDEGLILTNHHCITACLTENSSKDRSLLDEGFVARGRSTEVKCPTQIADVLVAMENVTEKVSAATRGMDDRSANDARKKTLTELELSIQALYRHTPRLCARSRYRGVWR